MSGSVGIGPAAPNRNLTVSTADGSGAYANIKNANHEVLLGVDSAAVLSAMTASDLQIRTNNVTQVVCGEYGKCGHRHRLSRQRTPYP